MPSLVKTIPTLMDQVYENVLHLLFIEDPKTQAEWLAKVLRNFGYSVRQTIAKNSDELDSIIQTQVIDLAVCSAAARSPNLEQVREAIDDSGKVPAEAYAKVMSLESGSQGFKIRLGFTWLSEEMKAYLEDGDSG